MAELSALRDKNEKLTLALTRLRDLAVAEKTELQTRVRSLEKEVAGIAALRGTRTCPACHNPSGSGS
jgi:hypothetical protein